MSHSYSNIDFDPSVFPHPHQSCPSGHATSLPPYLSDPPPSYYSPPIAPPSYSFPQKTYDPQPVPDLKAGILQTPPAISSFPDDGITFSPSPRSVEHPARDTDRTAGRITIAHPYARLYAKKDGSKRRKIWNHVLEKQLFSPQELSTMGAPHRRTIYIASLEAHIDRLHNQLLGIGLYPIPFDRLEPYRGLNSKTAKSMVAGLQHDATHIKLKLLELERSSTNLRKLLGTHNPAKSSLPSPLSAMALEADVRRHSVDISGIGMGIHTGHGHANHLQRS
ncbi:hypothetical protein PAXINDRAFT_95211 [Paxillus involutus ATCC 200175]|nr:hypothetical protein PAXINDRAFT_95211 [Paxillus involutus ATCC 200175]